MFLGIPFAQPPIGELRWKSPQPVEPWSEPLVADSYGPVCPQARNGEPVEGASEDCLTLNVWTPSVEPEGEPLPVMVWLHPGSFSVNSGSTWDADDLAAIGDVVIVSPNYRLNVFGFLGMEALLNEDPDYPSTGNYGIEDQQLALKWVQQNIASFGGDPDNVTLFGESSGGMAVCVHLVSPQSQGLFSKAVNQSGPCAFINQSLEQSIALGQEIATDVGCQDAEDVLGCMRGKSTEELLAALPAETSLIGLVWGPAVDDYILPVAPSEGFAQGAVAQDIPNIMMATKDEQNLLVLFRGKMDIDEQTYQTIIADLTPSEDDLPKILEQYAASKYETPALALGDFLTDREVKCTMRNDLRALDASGVDAYMAHFTIGRPQLPGMEALGAFHTVDVDFVMFTDDGDYALTEEEATVSRSIISYWSSLAYTGNPNANASGVAWPEYDADDQSYIEFGSEQIRAGSDLFPQCDFWDEIWSVAE